MVIENILHRNFNSQPHEEADFNGYTSGHKGTYFNSQPHEEADRLCWKSICWKFDFNSQPHEEADEEDAKC